MKTNIIVQVIFQKCVKQIINNLYHVDNERIEGCPLSLSYATIYFIVPTIVYNDW